MLRRLAIWAIVATIAHSQPREFLAANLVLDELRLFPLQGPFTTLSLPRSSRGALIASGYPDGKSIYLTTSAPRPDSVIRKIDIQSGQENIITGSTGFVRVDFLVASSGRFYVAGYKQLSQTSRELGVFEIDPSTGTSKLLQSGDYLRISPDGKRAIRNDDRIIRQTTDGMREIAKISIANIGKDTFQKLDGVSRAEWSPDGRFLLVVHDGHLELLDVITLARLKKLGSADAFGVWSPDSKWILYQKSQFSCSLTPYGASLGILDVETGRRTTISSSHCNVVGGPITWVDANSLK